MSGLAKNSAVIEGDVLNGIEIINLGINIEGALPLVKGDFINFENGPKIFDLLRRSHQNTFKEVIWLYKQACMFYLLKDDSNDVVKRINLLETTFLLNIESWDVNPVYLHLICKSLWDITRCDQNVIKLSKKLCTVSRVGFNISICLAWASTFRLLNKPIKMFRLRKFHELVDMLEGKDISFLKENLNKSYILLQIISFLQNVIVLKKANEYIPTQLKSYFSYKKEDLNRLKKWCILARQMFEINLSNEPNVNSAYTLIYELLDLDILYCLENMKQRSCDNI